MNRNKKLILTFASTAVMTAGFVLSAFAGNNGWQTVNGKWKYTDSNNNYITDAWRKSGDKYFYLDNNGDMVMDAIINDGNNLYAVDKNGAMIKNGWYYTTNEEYVRDDNQEGAWIYLQDSGKAKQNGWETIERKKYHFTDGVMDEGWVNIDQNYYYMNEKHDGFYGSMRTGWVYVDSFDENDNGKPVSDNESDGWYYFDTNGKMVSGKEKKIGNAHYVFDENGKMLDQWVEMQKATGSDAVYKYFRESNGDRIDGWIYLNDIDNGDSAKSTEEGWYYFKKGIPYSTTYKTTKIADGYGVAKIKGKIYCFDDNGKMITGKVDSSNGKYFYFSEDRNDGSMKYGKVKLTNTDDLDEGTYFFKEKGSIGIKGGSYTGENKGYLYDNGKLVKAEDSRYMIATVDGKNYLVNTSGKIQKKGTHKDSDTNIKYTVKKDASGNYVITSETY